MSRYSALDYASYIIVYASTHVEQTTLNRAQPKARHDKEKASSRAANEATGRDTACDTVNDVGEFQAPGNASRGHVVSKSAGQGTNHKH